MKHYIFGLIFMPIESCVACTCGERFESFEEGDKHAEEWNKQTDIRDFILEKS